MPLAARPLWICLACSLLAPGIAWAQRPPQVRTPEEENARAVRLARNRYQAATVLLVGAEPKADAPLLSVKSVQVGATGVPGDPNSPLGDRKVFFEVARVIDATQMIVRCGNQEYWLAGYSTRDLVEGQDVVVKNVLRVTGNKTRMVMATEKDYLILECVSERSATAAEKPPTTVAATGPQRIKWNNTSYNTTIYHVEGKTWEEKDNQSGKVKWQLTETDRTDEYIQLVNPTRKQSWRLTAKRMELKEGSDWKWLANGAWQPPSR